MCVRRLAFIANLVNVFSLLRAQKYRSGEALDTEIVKYKRVNIVCVMS